MEDSLYTKACIKKINQRCAKFIREANTLADQQIEYIRFIQKEMDDGATKEQAITTAIACFNNVKFLEFITEIMEEVTSGKVD